MERVGKHIDAGMLACNDFATCYMCQSLPMGGLKDSGFGKFAGIEGLRGLCVAKAVVEDIVPFIRAPRDRVLLMISARLTYDGGRSSP